MKKIYSEVKELTEKLNELGGDTVGKDGLSILIGIADCNEGVIVSLGAMGREVGILEMLKRIAWDLYEGVDDEENGFDEDFESEQRNLN